ncbi:MAG TPA: hypothetical protein DDZ51_11820, partial [Planctomycetaceae bacterium]|nr:hypothetical protein [Planctomycetaceae bacterium]
MESDTRPPNESAEVESEANAVPDGWDDPAMLPDPLLPVMPYESDLLPSAIGDAVNDIADRMQCPPDFPAASMLVALAAVVGCRIGVRPKRYDDWLVIPNLWGCAVGRPSLKKSPAISPAEKRVRAIESRERQRLSAEVESFEVDHVLGQASIKAIKSKIVKSVKAGNPEEARSLALDLIAVEGSSPP